MALLPTNALPQAEAADVLLREMLPPYLLHVIDFSFLRSHYLYDEFVYRLTLQVIRETGLESATQDGGSAEAIAARSGLAVDQAVVPLDWMLRLLATRGVLEEAPGASTHEFWARGPLPSADPAAVREEQLRHDPSWLPSYVLAETVAQDYPAFLRVIPRVSSLDVVAPKLVRYATKKYVIDPAKRSAPAALKRRAKRGDETA